MGITAIKHVYDRCKPGEGRCQVWQQGVNGKGYPQATIHGSPMLVARFVLMQSLGRQILPKHCAVPRCGNKRCVSAHCLREVSRSDVLSDVYRTGRRRVELELEGRRGIMLAQGKAKLDMQKAREIRLLQGRETATDLAKQFGVSRKTITSIWAGQRWAEAANGSSVFAWRPAA